MTFKILRETFFDPSTSIPLKSDYIEDEKRLSDMKQSIEMFSLKKMYKTR